MRRLRTTAAAGTLVLLFSSVSAAEVTRQLCTDVVQGLGFPVTPYLFKEGWLGDKHLFAQGTECFEREGELFVTSDGTVLVEDGFYGPEALAARDRVLQEQKQATKKARADQNELVLEARDKYDTAVFGIDAAAQEQLRRIREDNVPSVVLDAIEKN